VYSTGRAASTPTTLATDATRGLLPAVPAPVAPLIGLLVGVTFHWSGSRQLARAARGTAIEIRAQLLVLAYTLLLFAPFNAYFLAFSTDWAFVYLVDVTDNRSALVLASLFADCASVLVGFNLGRRFMADKRPGALAALLVPTGALLLLFLVGASRRLGVAATYAQYHGDFGVRPLGGSPLGYALLWFGAVFVAGTVWTALQLRHLGE
jgi:hypothetical protein